MAHLEDSPCFATISITVAKGRSTVGLSAGQSGDHGSLNTCKQNVNRKLDINMSTSLLKALKQGAFINVIFSLRSCK